MAAALFDSDSRLKASSMFIYLEQATRGLDSTGGVIAVKRPGAACRLPPRSTSCCFVGLLCGLLSRALVSSSLPSVGLLLQKQDDMQATDNCYAYNAGSLHCRLAPYVRTT